MFILAHHLKLSFNPDTFSICLFSIEMADDDKTKVSQAKDNENQIFQNDWLAKSEDVQTSFYNQLMQDFGQGQTNET